MSPAHQVQGLGALVSITNGRGLLDCTKWQESAEKGSPAPKSWKSAPPLEAVLLLSVQEVKLPADMQVLLY